MTRRTLLATPAASLAAAPIGVPVLDTHIHLFDPTRPQGIPWPPKVNKLIYKPTLPSHFAAVAKPHGVTGAIMVECSPWFDDNQWVLDVIANDKLMVGMVGMLDPDQPEFRSHLDRFARNPLFLGIRYGYLWNRDLSASLKKPDFVTGLKALAAAGKSLDSANPTARLLDDLLRLTDLVPDLRIIIDHLPKIENPDEAQIRQFAARKQVYVKLSAVLKNVNGRISRDVAQYRGILDLLRGVFGDDRVLYGSDWPNSEPLGPYDHVFGIVRDYFAAKPRAVQEKYFYSNSIAAYRWKNRA
jgi:predicted TIM-barrel fold metal-dependent hydrolase